MPIRFMRNVGIAREPTREPAPFSALSDVSSSSDDDDVT